jgi:hypothetical protein
VGKRDKGNENIMEGWIISSYSIRGMELSQWNSLLLWMYGDFKINLKTL